MRVSDSIQLNLPSKIKQLIIISVYSIYKVNLQIQRKNKRQTSQSNSLPTPTNPIQNFNFKLNKRINLGSKSMLSHQRSAQQKVFNPDKWREIECEQRKLRIKLIYGVPQEQSNRFANFLDYKQSSSYMKSSSLNPQISRQKLAVDQSIIQGDDQRIIPNSVIKELRKNNQIYTNNNTTITENAVDNSQIRQQNQSQSIKQDTLLPFYQNKEHNNNSFLEKDNKYKQTIDLNQFNQLGNSTPLINRVDTNSNNNRSEQQNLLMQYLTNTKILQKQEYILTTSQSITPKKGREDTINSRKRKKKRSKSKKNLKRFYSPNQQLQANQNDEDKGVSQSVISNYQDNNNRDSSPIYQYQNGAEFNGRQKQNANNENKLENLKNFDINLSNNNGSSEFQEQQDQSNLQKSNDSNSQQQQQQLLLDQQREQSKNKQISPTQIRKNYILPSLNQNTASNNLENLTQCKKHDKNITPHRKQYYIGNQNDYTTVNKLSSKRDSGKNLNQSLIIQRSKSPDLSNYAYKNYNDKKLHQSSLQQSFDKSLMFNRNEIQRAKSTNNNQKLANNELNKINDNKVNEIFQQKYSHELPSNLLCPIRKSQNYKKQNQEELQQVNEIDVQAREYSSNLLKDYAEYQRQIEQSIKKQIIQRYKTASKNQIPSRSRSPNLPYVNLNKQQLSNSLIINDKYQYIVEKEPKFQIKVLPRQQITLDSKCTCHLVNDPLKEIVYLSPNKIAHKEISSPTTKVYSQLQYSQSYADYQKRSNQNSFNLANTSNTFNEQQQFISNKDHQQYLTDQIKSQLQSSDNLNSNEEASCMVEKDSPIMNKQKNQKSKQESPLVSDRSQNKTNLNNQDKNSRLNSQKSFVSDKNKVLLSQRKSSQPQITDKSQQQSQVKPLKKIKTQEISEGENQSKLSSNRSSLSNQKKQQNEIKSTQQNPTQDKINDQQKSEPYSIVKQNSIKDNKDQKPPLRRQSSQKQKSSQEEQNKTDTQNELKQNNKEQSKDLSNKNNGDQSKISRKQSIQVQNESNQQGVQQTNNEEITVKQEEKNIENRSNSNSANFNKEQQNDDQKQKIIEKSNQNEEKIQQNSQNQANESQEKKDEQSKDMKEVQNQVKDIKQENQKNEDNKNNKDQPQKRKDSVKDNKQVNDLYQYQLNINFNQQEVEEIYQKLVQFTVKKRRECCLEPFFQKAEHVIWIDNFQIKIDCSFQNQMLFKMRIGNQDEAKIYLKYEDTNITNQWIFTKLKDSLKCLPLKESEGYLLSGKNSLTSLKCFFSIVYLQTLKFEVKDLDYQYVNYSEELMKIIKSLCINTHFSNTLSKSEKNPCVQINNFPVFFPSYNTIAYENEIYIDLEEINLLFKRQGRQYSERQILSLIQDMLENISKLHSKNITINNININNIVYSKESNSFKLLSYAHSQLNEDNLTPRDPLEVEQKYQQNPIYFSLQKFNQYKRDIYALGICSIIAKFQLTDFSINKNTINEKIEFMKQNQDKSLLYKIIIELIEQQQVLRFQEIAQTYLNQFFQPNDQIKQDIQVQQQKQQTSENSQLQEINKSLPIDHKHRQNIFEEQNLFEGLEQKQQTTSSNQQIQELQVLKKCYEHCCKINQFFNSYQSILDTQRQTYGLSSAIYLENLVEFYFEALHHNQKDRVASVIDFIEKENLFVFISQIPKNQQPLRFMIVTAFKFLIENNIDKAMKYFDRSLTLPNLTVQDLFQLNLNLGILANLKQKKQRALIYLQQAQYVSKSISKSSINLAAPYLLSGILNEDEKDLEIALKIKSENGEDQSKILNLIFKIGSLYLKKKNFSKGEETFRTILQTRGDVEQESQRIKKQYFQAKLNLSFCILGNQPNHPILNVLINDYLIELRQIYGQQSKETLYALYEISEVLVNLKVDIEEVLPIYTQCKQIATLINDDKLLQDLEAKIESIQTKKKQDKS
ncbi:hypothetical protein TTHERM_00079680 (macronuclear) [Tetrahymena thermophila SB210]|uniref:Uncharacterized protein n=1 Tax=Tetrahymena thermophila (strain SB210) TaxID=312017 RepID=Q23FP7_TETTS|nr:hypothetical protein TTHERM_00079680 [Tetrahymena thermophila SB210]EAR95563.2 hypothetical protein TTHERM_00079680 [Tetrahymena thermophila SB210]|eukprot:XP_001015808.2 hypothetical protein TTHERM_00079680 [Tetrahymena thermophila SB210]